MRVARLVWLALLAIAFTAGEARAELSAIWALDDGTKVGATEVAHPLRRGNGIQERPGAPLRLFGARNEVVAFQLILVGGLQPSAGVRLQLPSVGPIENGQLSADPDRHFVDRRIEIFRQHYLEIKTRSRGLVWEPWTAAQPKVEGWIPDALVPLTAGQRFDVPAGRNQGIWIDIYIPKSTPPGRHSGEVTIDIAGQPCGLPNCRLRLDLEVLSQTLPDEPTSKTMLFFSGSEDNRDIMAARYYQDAWGAPAQQVEALRMRHYHLGRRHRITMITGQEKEPTASLRRRLSGQAFGRDAGYSGPGETLGQDLYSIHTYGGRLTQQQAQGWHGWFRQHAPQATYFLYVVDEPGAAQYAEANEIARQAQPVPTFVTSSYTSALEFDIYAAPAEGFSLQRAKDARAAAKQQWIYNGRRPFSGTFVTDDVAISTRVNPWIQYKFKIPRWFYWDSTYYRDAQGGRGNIDVWEQAHNFSNASGDRLNGDGLLIYPGRDVLFPQQDRRLELPIPSIRLKNWRRGIQDVEYLVLAEKAGHAEAVRQLLETLLPRVLDQTSDGEPVSWPEQGERWLAARRYLAELLRTGEAPALDQAIAADPEPFWKPYKRWLGRWIRRLGGKKPVAVAVAAGGVGCLVACGVALSVWRRRRRRAA